MCCNIERKTYVDWGIVIFLISFPFASMGTAGWIATTLNYSWCVAAGILALMPLRNILQEKATPIWLYVLATVALLYAVSQEQMCALMLGVCSVASVYLFCKNKQIPWYSLLQTAVSFGGIVFVLTCPGNSARLLENTEYWFPEFAEMSFLHKAELGYSRAMYEFIMKPNCVFSLFCAILLIAVVLYNKKAIYRIIALVPFVASVVLGEFSAIFDQVFPAFAILRKALTKTGTGIDLSSLKTLIPVLTVTFIALSVMISLYAVFGKTYTTLFLNYILLLGLATAWIMGFSPTVWASQERTFIFMYMSFIAVGAFVLNKIFENPQWKNTEILMWVLFTTQGLVLVDEYLLTVLK